MKIHNKFDMYYLNNNIYQKYFQILYVYNSRRILYAQNNIILFCI